MATGGIFCLSIFSSPKQTHPGCSSRFLMSHLGTAALSIREFAGLIPSCLLEAGTFFKRLQEVGCVVRESALELDKMFKYCCTARFHPAFWGITY
jgi:hypothetical protein